MARREREREAKNESIFRQVKSPGARRRVKSSCCWRSRLNSNRLPFFPRAVAFLHRERTRNPTRRDEEEIISGLFYDVLIVLALLDRGQRPVFNSPCPLWSHK